MGFYTNQYIVQKTALLSLVVIALSVVTSVPVTASSGDDTVCLTQLPEVGNMTISQECNAKNELRR